MHPGEPRTHATIEDAAIPEGSRPLILLPIGQQFYTICPDGTPYTRKLYTKIADVHTPSAPIHNCKAEYTDGKTLPGQRFDELIDPWSLILPASAAQLPDPLLADRIAQLLLKAEIAAAHAFDNEIPQEELDRLEEAIDDLMLQLDGPEDGHVRPGRYLSFPIPDGRDSRAEYIIDRVGPLLVHCRPIANANNYTSEAIDTDGYTLKTIAQENITRREAEEWENP